MKINKQLLHNSADCGQGHTHVGKQLMLRRYIIGVVAFIFFLLFSSASIYAADKWDSHDIALEVTWQVMHGVDWLQTCEIARNPRYVELNPVMGKYPSSGRVNAYMGASAVLHGVVSHYARGKCWGMSCRNLFQWVTIGITGAVVTHNYRIGVRF